jgi:hypothetical protein
MIYIPIELKLKKHEQIANVVAFLSLLFGEDSEAWNTIMEFNPNYIIEKFERYILSARTQYPWGLHPSLRSMRFQRYVDKWELELKDE